jgi:hypothetical protein
MESFHTLFFPQSTQRSTKVQRDGEKECGSTARTAEQNYQHKESSVMHDADRRMSEQNSEKNS